MPEEVISGHVTPKRHHDPQRSATGTLSNGDTSAKSKDPVCGMLVERATARHKSSHAGQDFVFCSARCLEKFALEPSRYLVADKTSAVPAAPAGIIYTCPMHPQIRQAGPGNCPICGMTLEPVTATATVGPNRELADKTLRFLVGLVLAWRDDLQHR